MTRVSLILAAAAAFCATPALACGMINQAAGSGGMCAAPAATAAPGGQAAPATPAGGCPCCRNMAMMTQNSPTQGTPAMPGMSMPGMSMPGMRQEMPAMPRAPEAPKQ